MIKIFLTYFQQRYFGWKFLCLSLFLWLYAKGNLRFERKDIALLFFAYSMVFVLRLFDDLKNRKYDAGKPNRIYTDELVSRPLYTGLICLILLMLAILFDLNILVAFFLALFFILNGLLYFLLSFHTKCRVVLPLLKYPVICFAILGLSNGFFSVASFWVSLTLLPAFLLIESLMDPAFILDRSTRYTLFVLTFVPLFFLTREPLTLTSVVLIAFAFFSVVYGMKGFSAYVFLLMLLFTRYTL